MPKPSASWGFDARELSPSIRPQDDFYHHVHRKWMDKNPIPKVESRWGAFTILRYETDQKLHTLLKDLLKAKPSSLSSGERLVRDFFVSGMDLKARNARGLSPLLPYLKKIEKLRTEEDLQKLIAEFHVMGVGVLWGAGIDQDLKASEKYALYLAQDGLGMPDREYYLKDDAESKRVRDAYLLHVERLFKLMGRNGREGRDTVLRIETELAKASMKKEDAREAEKTYHKHTKTQLKKLAPTVDWSSYMKRTYADKADYYIVMQPEFFRRVNTLLSEISLEDWKTYLAFHLVNDYASGLSDAFVKASFAFYGKVLTGTPSMKPLWRRVLGTVNGGLGELIGQLYVKRHFPPEAKKKMNQLVDDLFIAYEARLKSLEWMTPATKKKALIKLKAFNRKIGYPDKWKSYAGLTVSSDDFVGNVVRLSIFEHKRQMKKLGRPIDRGEWFMYPQTVNAYFHPTLNDIVFPASILQPPFFSFSADDAMNYGAIGSVIGHEITHGFDDEGSKFDAKGNLKSWWTKEDRKRFDAKAKKVVKQFDRYEVADGVKVNGQLTVGENIADLGGLSIAYDAYQLQLKRTGRRNIDGLSPEERFFIGFSIFERENVRPEFAKTHALTDPHSPGVFRINGPVSNFEPFYETYNLKKTDGLYRLPKDREMVW